MKAINLKCEFLKNPSGIDIKNPRITWNVEGTKDQNGFIVTYRVNDGEFKKTELIKTSSMNYTFESENFKSRDRIEYFITLVAEEGNLSEESEHAFLEFGLLDEKEFVAHWIKGGYKVNKKRRYPADYFKKEFEINFKVKRARLYATALGVYEASLNGKKVDDSVLNPGSTNYHHRIQYQTYDVTNLIKTGTNSLNFVLGDGWYRGSNGAWGHRNVYGKETKLYAQLEIYDEHENVIKVLSDDSFLWSNDGPIGINDLKDGERVRAYLAPTYSKKALMTKDKVVNLKSSNNFAIKEMNFFKPKAKYVSSSGKLVIEFPQMITGYVSFKINAKQGDLIKIKFAEMVDENGEINQNNIQLKASWQVTPLQMVVYECKDGLNEYKPKFYYGGFKYIEVESNIIDVEDKLEVEAIAIYNAFEDASSFECSNELINKFYNNTLWSLKDNSVDVPTDCPTRERAGWTGDAQIFFDSAAYLVNYASFARKYINDLNDTQTNSGKYYQIVPTVGEDFYMSFLNGSVGWACAGVLIPYRFYLKYGDKRILENSYENMFRYAKFMISRCGKTGVLAPKLKMDHKVKKYLVNKGQSYGEWLEPREIYDQSWKDVAVPHPEESTAYTNYTLSKMREIALILGKEKDAKYLEKYIDGTKRAYQELIKIDGYKLDTNRQAKLVRPLYMNLLEDKIKKYAQDRLVKALDDFNWRIGTGFLSTPFILDVLTEINPEYAYRLIENEENPGWLFMAKNDTTSIWESWEGPVAKTGVASLNHYSKGALVEWLFKGMLGINIICENRFLIKPIIGGHLTYAKGSYESIYGKVSVSWVKENNKYKIDVSLPANTISKIEINNKILENVKGGEHHFEYEI